MCVICSTEAHGCKAQLRGMHAHAQACKLAREQFAVARACGRGVAGAAPHDWRATMRGAVRGGVRHPGATQSRRALRRTTERRTVASLVAAARVTAAAASANTAQCCRLCLSHHHSCEQCPQAYWLLWRRHQCSLSCHRKTLHMQRCSAMHGGASVHIWHRVLAVRCGQRPTRPLLPAQCSAWSSQRLSP